MQTHMHPQSSRFITGYDAASEFTGIHRRRLERWVESRRIRAVKPNDRTILFHTDHLLEDILEMEAPKI
jgi:excisionase family DNA binding protein